MVRVRVRVRNRDRDSKHLMSFSTTAGFGAP